MNSTISAFAKKLVRDNVLTTKETNMLVSAFYRTARRVRVKQGAWDKRGGRTVSNAEWVLVKAAFIASVESSLSLCELLNSPPKDLLAYGKKPKAKVHERP